MLTFCNLLIAVLAVTCGAGFAGSYQGCGCGPHCLGFLWACPMFFGLAGGLACLGPLEHELHAAMSRSPMAWYFCCHGCQLPWMRFQPFEESVLLTAEKEAVGRAGKTEFAKGRASDTEGFLGALDRSALMQRWRAPDVRVSMASGGRAVPYGTVRLSVIGPPVGDGGGAPDSSSKNGILRGKQIRARRLGGGDNTAVMLDFGHQEPFKYRWKASFDLGREGELQCQALAGSPPTVPAPYSSFPSASEETCIRSCTDDDHCKYFAYTPSGIEREGLLRFWAWCRRSRCELYHDCPLDGLGLVEKPASSFGKVIFTKYHRNVLYSTLLTQEPGAVYEYSVVDSYAAGPGQDSPGEASSFPPREESAAFRVRVPEKDEGVTGIFLADPCFSGRYLECSIGVKWEGFRRTFELQNAIFAGPNRSTRKAENHPSVERPDFFMLLGDNFYDRYGRLNKAIYDNFSLGLKSAFSGMIMGNHDFWSGGNPGTAGPGDNFGYGFMQWYPMDVEAGEKNPAHVVDLTQGATAAGTQGDDSSGNSGERRGAGSNASAGSADSVFDMSVDPDAPDVCGGCSVRGVACLCSKQHKQDLVPHKNFFWYHKFGNVGFLGFSGATKWEETLPSFQKACAFFAQTKPAYVFLMGHWAVASVGVAEVNMMTPRVAKLLEKVEGCDFYVKTKRLKFFDGHLHCNYRHYLPDELYPDRACPFLPDMWGNQIDKRDDAIYDSLTLPMPRVDAEQQNRQPDGFMCGAHGMDSDVVCAEQMGFLYVDGTGGESPSFSPAESAKKGGFQENEGHFEKARAPPAVRYLRVWYFEYRICYIHFVITVRNLHVYIVKAPDLAISHARGLPSGSSRASQISTASRRGTRRRPPTDRTPRSTRRSRRRARRRMDSSACELALP